MQLDSARELKRELVAKLIDPVATASGQSIVAFSARAVTRLEGPFRTLSLGISRKGKTGFQLAVRVQRREFLDSDLIKKLAERAKGEIDVRYVGQIAKMSGADWPRGRVRPLRIGSSLGHYQITAGTLGCFVKRRSGDATPLMLSNNHVLANENHGSVGDAIIQPGDADGGSATHDRIGRLAEFVPLSTSGSNVVDAAVAAVDPAIEFGARYLDGAAELTDALAQLAPGDAVSKLGRTTGVTRGKVVTIEMQNVVVGYDIGNCRFDNVIELEGVGSDGFSRGGDSGSLIIDGNNAAAALLFAGSDQGGANNHGLTYANPIQSVFDALDVDLL